ncbi:protein EPIDERMAL PATTERNING FACTOR 1-like [Mangifera indica]|uniref:protein EPIDERMAL PATTERNING FACTOR 1-like n=1 Tax=Mangifera indica TaxID=29780 RepID=UPI001CFB387A|nr:protein EPIDERMAL PATTERNING FACTOR 1-like [Mangifera indica]
MKGSVWIALLVIVIFFVPSVMSSRHIGRPHSHDGHHHTPQLMKTELYWERVMKRKGAETLEIAGSRLPDCSHACGSCVPCRLVIVSFVCASLEEAETCPIAYKCMCNDKSYPVP